MGGNWKHSLRDERSAKSVPQNSLVLDIGCGKNKLPGAVGLDIVKADGVDVIHDLDRFPYPFPDNQFDLIFMHHIIEHVNRPVKVVEEIYRLLKPNGIVEIATPHYTDDASWMDPTHLWHFHSESFVFFDPEYHRSYITTARFKTVYSYVTVHSLFRMLGIEFLVNLKNHHRGFRFFRRTWEKYLSFIIRGGTIYLRLQAVK